MATFVRLYGSSFHACPDEEMCGGAAADELQQNSAGGAGSLKRTTLFRCPGDLLDLVAGGLGLEPRTPEPPTDAGKPVSRVGGHGMLR